MPFYDEDSDVLWLAGKGDGNIRYYELDMEGDKNNMIFYISQYGSNEPTAACCAMPKRGCDVSSNEIIKLFKVAGTQIQPLSFKVPRKSGMFQDDIFPDCRSDEPALTAEQWFAGETSKPKTKGLEGGFQSTEKKRSCVRKKKRPLRNSRKLIYGKLMKNLAKGLLIWKLSLLNEMLKSKNLKVNLKFFYCYL